MFLSLCCKSRYTHPSFINVGRNHSPVCTLVPTRTVNTGAPDKGAAWGASLAEPELWLPSLCRIPSMENPTDGTWDRLPVKLSLGVLETLEELKFSHMTPVQVTLLCNSARTEVAVKPTRLNPLSFSPVCLHPAVHDQQGRGCRGGEFSNEVHLLE